MNISERRWGAITGILLALLGVFLVLGLATHHPTDIRHLFHARNYAGFLGAFTSQYLFAFLGIAAFLLPALCFLWAVNRFRLDSVRSYVANSVFGVLVAVWLDVVLAHALPRVTWRLFPLGGSLGRVLESRLAFFFGATGLVILLAAFFVLLLLVFTELEFRFPFARLAGLFRARPAKPSAVAVVPPARPRPARTPAETKPTAPTPAPAAAAATPEEPRVRRPAAPPARSALLECFHAPPPDKLVGKQEGALKREAELLLRKLGEFDIQGTISAIETGPVISRFEFEPAPGIKIQRIESLANDLALSLKAERIRILAPIPGKAAVGIEVPNEDRKMVYLRPVLESDAFTGDPSPLLFGVGVTITGEPAVADIRSMPHLLIAGTTGSGKSVCINTIIASIVTRATADEVRFITIDPKRLELPFYNPIPHLLGPTVVDPKRAVEELDDAVSVMEMRYRDFARIGARDIQSYNEKAPAAGVARKPYIIIVVDELADLMLTAPGEIEEKITRLAQMSRAVGIHLVLATQRPSVDVITGLIKANFPARIAFQVASKTDSRTILDMNGAESLLGRGDMLFLPPGKGEPVRLHGAYVATREAKALVDLVCRQHLVNLCAGFYEPDEAARVADRILAEDLASTLYEPESYGGTEKRRRLSALIPDALVDQIMTQGYYPPLPESSDLAAQEQAAGPGAREIDELFEQAARLVIRHKEASVSMLQRRLDVGWARAGRIVDQLEQARIVGPYVGSKARKVLVETEEELARILADIASAQSDTERG